MCCSIYLIVRNKYRPLAKNHSPDILSCLYQTEILKDYDRYNHGHNILRAFNVLPNFPFTTSETKPDY